MSESSRKSPLPISILICFNIVFAVCGIAIIGIGIIILRDVGRQLIYRLFSSSSGIITQIGLSLFTIGSFGILTSILGCTAAFRKCNIGWYIFCVSLTILAEIGLGISFLFFHEKGLDSSGIVLKIHTLYGVDQSFTQSIDYVQYKFNCCGSNSDADYDRSIWKNNKFGGNEIVVPWTCCPINVSITDFPPYMNPIPINATLCQSTTQPLKIHRYKEGCYAPVEKWLQKEGLTFLLMGLILFLLQISSLTASICLCRRIK